ncbi:unnamed protein product [Scytosiphon promiscuus]
MPGTAERSLLSRALRRRLPAPPRLAISSSLSSTPRPPVPTPCAAMIAGGPATRDSPVFTSRPEGWRSSPGFAAGGDADGAAAVMSSLPSAFPWREAPRTGGVRGLVDRAMHAVMQRQHRRFVRAASSGLGDNDDEGFLRAAEMAFVQVAAGAFQMPAHQVMAPLMEEGDDDDGRQESTEAGGTGQGRREGMPVWDIPEGAAVDPRDVMHKDLADFYLQAVVATKMSRCTPFYRLHGFGECRVSNINVLWGAQRGDVPEEGDKTTVEFFGSKYVWESTLEDIKALSRFLVLKDGASLDQRRMSSIRKTTVQVDVDMACSETFFVCDERTREVGLFWACRLGACRHAPTPGTLCCRLTLALFFRLAKVWNSKEKEVTNTKGIPSEAYTVPEGFCQFLSVRVPYNN